MHREVSPPRLRKRLRALAKKYRKPVFVEIECYRYRQHVGIGTDFDIGYRNRQELEEWLETDIIQNPQLVSEIVNTNLLLRERTDHFKTLFMKLSRTAG